MSEKAEKCEIIFSVVVAIVGISTAVFAKMAYATPIVSANQVSLLLRVILLPTILLSVGLGFYWQNDAMSGELRRFVRCSVIIGLVSVFIWAIFHAGIGAWGILSFLIYMPFGIGFAISALLKRRRHQNNQ